MTDNQRPYYFALWKNACERQGWTTKNGWKTKDIDAKRKQIHTEVFSHPKSSNDINTKEEFGKIKAKFLELADDLDGAIEVDHPELDHARRVRNAIGVYLKCLQVYLGDGADPMFAKILRDKFPVLRTVGDGARPTSSELVELLSPEAPKPFLRGGKLHEPSSDLDQALSTISGRVQAYRSLSGDSLHQMRIKAKVKCTCAQCVPRRPRLVIVPSPEVPESNVPF
jgi:hypothetical protein